MKIKKFSELDICELYEIARLREEVFFLEQKVDCEELDGLDPLCIHLWEEHEGQIVGYLRILPAGVAYAEPSIGRLAVRVPFRRTGLGRRLMERALEYIAAEWGRQPVKISAQAYLVDFYRSLGFDVVSDLYLEAGISHFKMVADYV